MMLATLKRWLWRLLPERHEIGPAGDVYLTRWVLLGSRYGPGQKLFLHRFRRSDSDEALHNHPWDFWSLILWGGYYEETFTGVADRETGERLTEKKWYGPLRLLLRPAGWCHRVELAPGRRAWTLTWTGPKTRSWGFFCQQGFVPWREFVGREDAGAKGCGDD